MTARADQHWLPEARRSRSRTKFWRDAAAAVPIFPSRFYLLERSDSPVRLRRRISARTAALSAFGQRLYPPWGSMPAARSAAFQEPNKLLARLTSGCPHFSPQTV